MSPRLAGGDTVRFCWRSARADRSACSSTCRYTSRASIAVVHRPSSTAHTISRERTVVRQSAGFASLFGLLNIDRVVLLSRGDDGLVGRRGRRHALDDDGLAASGSDEVELLGRDLFDAAGRLQRLGFEPQVTIDLFFGRALLLQPFDLVAVP